ncbi:hypothetical protein I5G19_15270 [Pseudomonas aeruginosa]|nr:hypothetical protein [Pseudomonas aeruginosa]
MLLPCSGFLASPTAPPAASASAWWPRQTPSTGKRPRAQASNSSMQPASSGRPGPGDSTSSSQPSASNAAWIVGNGVSLRITRTSAPSRQNCSTRL